MPTFKIHVYHHENGVTCYLMRLDGIPQSDLQDVMLEVQTWFAGFDITLVLEVCNGV